VRHRLGLATRTEVGVCKSPFSFAGTTVSLFRAKTVQQRPLLPREVETWFSELVAKKYVSVSGLYNQYAVLVIWSAGMPASGLEDRRVRG